jgi:hypothetical protein
MKHIIRRAVVILVTSAGLIAVTEAAAQAKLTANHSEPVARDHHAA